MNDFCTILSALASLFTVTGGAYAFGKRKGRREATLDLNNERESKRFIEIYAPLMGLFTTRHITTVSARGAPYLRQRVHNAIDCLHDRKLLQAFKALVDKKDFGISGEVEYGGTFPLAEITHHLKGRERFADQNLVNLIVRANRAQYEDQPSDNHLTVADILLFNHISREHENLVKRFVGE